MIIYTRQKKIQLHFPVFLKITKNSVILFILKCVNRTAHPMNFTHFDSIHFLLAVKEQDWVIFKCHRMFN